MTNKRQKVAFCRISYSDGCFIHPFMGDLQKHGYLTSQPHFTRPDQDFSEPVDPSTDH